MTAPASRLPAPLATAWAQGRLRWAALAERERRLLLLAATVLGLGLVWGVGLAPAWRTVQRAPAELEALDGQLQQMQVLATEARGLRAVPPLPLDQAQAALTAATERLGPQARLSLQGERAVLTVKGVASEQLNAWLAEARAGARSRVIEATLNQTTPGLYDGSLSLALGGRR